MTIASLSAVTITLTLVGIFLGVILNATKLAEDIRKNVDVSVFVDIGTEQKDMDTLEQSLKELPNVSDVRFSSRDDELKKFRMRWGFLELIRRDSNPLYNVYDVSATDPEYTKKLQNKLENCQMFSKQTMVAILLTRSLLYQLRFVLGDLGLLSY